MTASPVWTRREFGLIAGAATLLATTGCAAGETPEEPATQTLQSLGIQLYTVRESFVADALATLKTIAASGYAEVEFGGGGYFERDPAQLRSFVDEAGLVAPSMHCSTAELTEQMDRVIMVANTLGATNVVLPWVPEDMRGSREAWERVATLCTDAAARLSDEGIAFFYHNHDFEFEAVDGETTGLDIIAGETNPDLVGLEMDFYWAAAAGQDIDAVIESYAGRIGLCHVKDMAADGKMTLPGEGSMDYAAILKQSPKAGLQHYFVEDDQLLTADAERLSAASAHLLGMEIA